ncbi:MAG TPA: DUF6152 family protein [Vicinamibacterales bacterium]|nr:DUF6152 family protein [Vicinamibacterales bacterium]
MTRHCAGVTAIAAFLVLAAQPLRAHHGNASFDTSKRVTMKGTVTEWIWANPHCFLKIDAMDDTGGVRNWALETQNPTAMTQRGWSRQAFKIGDQVTVVLEAVKNGAAIGRIVSVMLPDGSTLTAGNLPNTTPPGQ